MPTSTYREFPPPAALARHLLCVWAQVIGAGDAVYRHRVLPDGCADVVWIGDAPAAVAGPATGAVIVPLAPRTLVIGIRLRPGAAQAVLGVPASELADRDTPLADIWSARAASLWERVAEQPSPAGRLAAAQAALAGRLADAGPPDAAIIAATRWLARYPEGPIEHPARIRATGERRLRRRFAAAVGYGPKTFQRVLRLQRVLSLASRQPGAHLAMIAADAGYADQAHMTREVGEFSGVTPSALLGKVDSALALYDLLHA